MALYGMDDHCCGSLCHGVLIALYTSTSTLSLPTVPHLFFSPVTLGYLTVEVIDKGFSQR